MRDVSKVFYTHEKLRKFINDLNGTRYRDRIAIADFDARCGEERFAMHLGEAWKGRDKYINLSFSISVPEEFKGKTVLFYFDFGHTGGGNNSGFEALFHLNGKPYQGVDSNHREVFIPNSYAGQTVDVMIRLWSGLEGGGEKRDQEHRLNQAMLCTLDEAIDNLYYNGRAINEVLNLVDPNDYAHTELENLLNAAFKITDYTNPGSQAFYESLYEANAFIESGIAKMEKHEKVTINCVGHTHIDVAWLWRLKHTREKAGRSFSTAVRLMEMFPDYIFIQSQPRLYDYVKTDYPALYEEIKAAVKRGNWEPEGAMWLEADCNLTSGESLVRQILVGKRFFKQEFGTESDFLWLPDVFGYSWALPQILKKSGVNTFITSKISWNQYNRMPHDTFNWRGIDGSEVLTYFITTPGEHDSDESWYSVYGPTINANSVKKTWNKYVDKQINNELIMPYGYGDGGGGVNREMLEMRRRFDKLVGMPNVKTRKVGDVLKDIRKNLETTGEYVHTWDGELYLEYHRGTYTSQARNKRYNRKLELLYRETELYSVISKLLHNTVYDKAALNDGWKIILTNQFHDIIPGSSIHEVYEDSTVDYELAKAIALKLNEAAKIGFVKPEGHVYTVFNNSNFHTGNAVYLQTEDTQFTTGDGNPLVSQKTKAGVLVYLPELSETGNVSVVGTQGNTANPKAFGFKDHVLETPFYTVTFENGQIASLYDKEAKRQVLAGNGNVLNIYEDKPMNFDAWDIDIYYKDKCQTVSGLQKFEAIEDGPLCFVISAEYTFNQSKISQNMKFYAYSRRIDFETAVDWRERQKLLKVAFPVNIRSTYATYDIQYGNVQRPTHYNTQWDLARFEVVGHQWADLSETNYGVALLNDCKYGHSIKDNEMMLSLLKGAVYPDPQADLGKQEFTYSLLPHMNDWKHADVVKEAWYLNNPLTYTEGSAKPFSLFKTEGGGVLIDAVKLAEDGDEVILRLHDYNGERKQIKITSDLSIKSYCECDLLERQTGASIEQNEIEFEIKPYEIKTFRITFNK